MLNTLLFSQEAEFGNLLKEYENSQALYLNTKEESAGHLIVFSRSDLDRMQAYTLDDVLKTLRMFTAQVNSFGLTTLVKADAANADNQPIKLYINSHQLNSVMLGNPLTQYGKINLYFVDHIEVYQSGTSVTFGDESSGMVIKLYTKDPARENGLFAQVSADNRGASSIEVLSAEAIGKDYSYMINADISNNKHKKYSMNNSELSRDNMRGQFYFKFSKTDNYDIEVGAVQENFDTFNGAGMAPLDSSAVGKEVYINVTKYFDNQIKVMVSAFTEAMDMNLKDINGMPLSDTTISRHLELAQKADVFHAAIQKKFTYEKNNVYLGAEIKQTSGSIDKFKSEGLDRQMQIGPKKLTMYMFSAEESYALDDNNILIADIKLDYYKNDFSKTSLLHLYRLGYTSVNKSFDFKVYGTTKELYPTFEQTSFSPYHNPNPNLDSYKINSLTSELAYKTDMTKYTAGFGVEEAQNAAVFDINLNMYINHNKNMSSKSMYARIEHTFDLENKIILEYFKSYQKENLSPDSGGLIQLFNKIGRFNFYNELVYRNSFTDIANKKMDAGYDYTLAVSYPVSKKMEIKLKGENLLDKASQTSINGFNVPAVERRALLTMEYAF